MATGDAAAAAGLPVVPPTKDIRVGYDDINALADRLAAHQTTGGHAWDKISSKPPTFPPDAHTHDDRYFTEAEINAKIADINEARATADTSLNTAINNGLAGKAPAGAMSGNAVRDVTGANSMGLRWNGAKPVVRVDTSEWELARMIDLPAGASYNMTVARADGSDRPHSFTPAGSGWYAVWVDGNHNFCRNTSSQRYKENIEDYAIDPADVLALQPRIYDRKGDDTPNGEVGLIAEEVHEHLPWLVTWHSEEDEEPQIDGVRYDLLGVALIPVVQAQAARITSLENRLQIIEQALGIEGVN